MAQHHHPERTVVGGRMRLRWRSPVRSRDLVVVSKYHEAPLIEGTISGLFRFNQAFNEDLNPNLIGAVG